MRLILVRHGQSLGNVEQRIQGSDDPLTDFGRQQAGAAAEALAKRGDITHLYASNLDRAFETASIIGKRIGLEPVPTPGLAEIDAGTAAGLVWADWVAQDPERAERLERNQLSPFGQWEGGESGQDLADRVLASYDEIVTRHLGSDDVVALVSHGGPLAWIAAKVYGDPLDIWPAARAGFLNCSISELEIDSDREQESRILSWNVTDHLEAVNRTVN
jgi:probable phosphoglycerate mutase